MISQVRDSDCGEYCYVLTSEGDDDSSSDRTTTCNIGAYSTTIGDKSNPIHVTIEKDNNGLFALTFSL